MASSMDKENIASLMAKCAKVFGTMENALNGWMRIKTLQAICNNELKDADAGF